ncbi:TlpA family protein disulfide reductase [Candidatus Woesearchaeota archaeon]|nr:TlpA family protein disulfide reductase [Candidatus Woesearchaeota archaeon]
MEGKINYRASAFLMMLALLSIALSSCLNNGQQQDMPVKAAVAGIEKGNIPPDFEVKTIDGSTLTLSQLKEQGKPTLLFFWATWCPSCAEDFAVAKKIYPEYADKINYVAIDLDTTEDIAMIREYADKLGINGIRFAEGNAKVLSDYRILSTTTKYALDKDGILLYKGSGAFNEKQWEVLLDGMLAN